MAHLSDINCVQFGPSIKTDTEEKTLLASCGDDGLIKIWGVKVLTK